MTQAMSLSQFKSFYRENGAGRSILANAPDEVLDVVYHDFVVDGGDTIDEESYPTMIESYTFFTPKQYFSLHDMPVIKTTDDNRDNFMRFLSALLEVLQHHREYGKDVISWSVRQDGEVVSVVFPKEFLAHNGIVSPIMADETDDEMAKTVMLQAISQNDDYQYVDEVGEYAVVRLT